MIFHDSKLELIYDRNPRIFDDSEKLILRYYSGSAIFDRACQNADMGPWNAIADDWSGYRRTYGC